VSATATIGITGAGLDGVLRLTWLRDSWAHVLEHSGTDETSGTWTGLACPDHRLALGSDVDSAVLRRMAGQGNIADLVWEAPEKLTSDHHEVFEAAMQAYHSGNPDKAELLWQEVQAVWSQAWAANYKALELLQNAGVTKFSPVKPQRWVVASFEHHCGPHGLTHPHVHNIVIIRLTAGMAVS
jgi:hypothetical protein